MVLAAAFRLLQLRFVGFNEYRHAHVGVDVGVSENVGLGPNVGVSVMEGVRVVLGVKVGVQRGTAV